MLRIAAVDCADIKNVQICYQNDINEYPLFGYYLPYSSSTKSTLKENEHSKSEQFMRTMIDAIMNLTDPPSNWPKLTPFK